VKRFWILDSRFWITRAFTSGSLAFLAAASMNAASKPTPTPTPVQRKLSGGFGSAGVKAATPAASQAPAAGQSLADAVRAASGTKKGKAGKVRVTISNDSLVTDPKKGKLTTSSVRVPSPAPSPVRVELAPTPTPAPTEEAETYWRERMHSARARVDDLRDLVTRLEGETKKLENDFYSWDDGQYRDTVIKPAWDRKLEELETARKSLEQAEKDLSELPEKARKAGALPGWLRE
jgi:hypothetical protein